MKSDRRLRIARDSTLWVELKEKPKKAELRLGIDGSAVFGASREGNRVVLFSPAAETHQHFTIVADPKSQRLTFHETEEHVEVIGGTRVPWNENAKPLFVLSGAHLERRCAEERFLAVLRARLENACRFVHRPQDFRSEGIGTVFATSTASDFRPVSGNRYELQLATFGPQAVESLWRSTPGTLFLAIGDNLKMVGITMLLEDGGAVLLRYRDAIAVCARFIRDLSEPASPPLDFFARL